jgi:hypothetical protein
LRGGGNFRRGGLIGGTRSLGVCSSRVYFVPRPFFLVSLFSGCYVASSFPLLCGSGYDVLPNHRPIINWTKQPRTDTSEVENQNKSFLLLGCLSQVFCQSNTKPTNTIFGAYSVTTIQHCLHLNVLVC